MGAKGTEETACLWWWTLVGCIYTLTICTVGVFVVQRDLRQC
jgi:hypothetical protein